MSHHAHDAGTGLMGSMAALVVFLALLLFAVQLLMNLYARSVITSAAHEAARVVAAGDVDHENPGAVAVARSRGERRARQLLGRFGDRVRMDWTSSDTTTVVLRVEAEVPRFLLPDFGGALGVNHIDRTVQARVERLQ